MPGLGGDKIVDKRDVWLKPIIDREVFRPYKMLVLIMLTRQFKPG